MSEKLTDSRRAALREKGIFPRSRDFNVLFATIGAIIGYRSLGLDLYHSYGLNQILSLTLIIPFGAAICSVLATLIQSRFLFRFSFSKEKKELNFTNFFYVLIKLILFLIIGGIVFRKLLADAAADTLNFEFIRQTVAVSFVGLLVLFGLVGLLVSKLTFFERYQMSKAEVEADDRDGEMRPEVKAAMDTNFANVRERD